MYDVDFWGFPTCAIWFKEEMKIILGSALWNWIQKLLLCKRRGLFTHLSKNCFCCCTNWNGKPLGGTSPKQGKQAFWNNCISRRPSFFPEINFPSIKFNWFAWKISFVVEFSLRIFRTCYHSEIKTNN